jgi:hypothetical protein
MQQNFSELLYFMDIFSILENLACYGQLKEHRPFFIFKFLEQTLIKGTVQPFE